MKTPNKHWNKIVNAIIVILAFVVVLNIIDVLKKGPAEKPTYDEQQYKDRIQEDSLKFLALQAENDSLYEVAKKYQIQAGIANNERNKAIKERDAEKKKHLATLKATESAKFFADVLGLQELTGIEKEMDTSFIVPDYGITRANMLFLDYDYEREMNLSLLEYQAELLMSFDKMEASAIAYRAQSDTLNKTNEFLKQYISDQGERCVADKKREKRKGIKTGIGIGATVTAALALAFTLF